MKANETTLHPIINRAEQQFIVPLFQRPYSWGKTQWQGLWDDLLDLLDETEEYSNNNKSHFIGSIVTIPVEHALHSVTKYVLIDGQQRLTTLFIILALIRDYTEDKQLADKIHEQQLINKFAQDENYYKLLPTQQDRPAFQALIDRKPLTFELEAMDIIECYRFFEKKLKKVDSIKLAQVISHHLTIVSIVLDANENPHLIFESLNARGKPLTQADLIRNYFFMRIEPSKQNAIFTKYWQPMQTALGENLTDYIRHYLSALKASIVKKTEVYLTLKNRLEAIQTDVLTSLKELKTYADYYYKILNPEQESELNIRAALTRINRIEITVAYPFLLSCYHDYQQHQLSATEFCQLLHLVENFVIRRSVCNIPTHGLNRVFPVVYRTTQSNNASEFINAVAHFLQTKDYPTDTNFKAALITANFYSRSEGRERTKLILESLEACYQHKETVDFNKLTIEHIMPQKLNQWWQDQLGDNWKELHQAYVHTLGNLTLTGYNSELSNRRFPEKQMALANSHIELNRYFATLSEWRIKQIEHRANELATQALTIWPYFGIEHTQNQAQLLRVKGSKPSSVTIQQQTFVVQNWRGVLEQVLNFIAHEHPDIFTALAQEHPRYISQNVHMFRRNAVLNNGYFVEVNFSADNIYRFCQKAMEKCGYEPADWDIAHQ